jgi:hypothetical protein
VSFSAKLRNLTAELRLLDQDFKSNPALEGPALREFRQALDNVRVTAWTVHELLNARESQKNPQAVISFLTAERMRRFSQMARNLSDDFGQNGSSWPAEAVKDLANSLTLLRERFGIFGESEQAREGA